MKLAQAAILVLAACGASKPPAQTQPPAVPADEPTTARQDGEPDEDQYPKSACTTIDGFVVSSRTGQPLVFAVVAAMYGDGGDQAAVTEADGSFSIKVAWHKLLRVHVGNTQRDAPIKPGCHLGTIEIDE